MPMLSLKKFEWFLAAHASDAVDAMFGALCDLYTAAPQRRIEAYCRLVEVG
jgi:hypothetical protein